MFDYIVAHRRLGEAEACKFFHQIVDGVEALHSFDVTHRDLKPEVRILLNPLYHFETPCAHSFLVCSLLLP